MERQLHNTINEYELGNKELASKVHYLCICLVAEQSKKSHVKIDMQIEREIERVVNEIFCCCIDSCKLPHLVLPAILINYEKTEKWEN